VVDEGPLAVDLDDGQPLAIAGLELGVAGDVHLAKLELDVAPNLCERALGTLAEAAVVGVVNSDAGSTDTDLA
jgi:hypothetical protein